MQPMPPHSRNHTVRTIFQLGGVLLATIAALNYNALVDEYALLTYHPTADVASFESRVSLTTPARASLYRTQPLFDSKTSFNTDCDTRPHELELGCYYRGHIYVLRIDNTSLAPEMDVVSAHELLHAVWSQMSDSERSSLTSELERFYGTLNDKDLQDRMASYATSEPGEEGNELHSILGTEFANLSPSLEAHYAKYFPKRNQIVAAHAAYQAVFDTRKLELEQELARIRSEKASLSVLNHQLETYRANNQIDTYNSLVPKQNKMVDDINSRIATYSQGVNEYNDLSKSLDSQQITDTEAPAQ